MVEVVIEEWYVISERGEERRAAEANDDVMHRIARKRETKEAKDGKRIADRT